MAVRAMTISDPFLALDRGLEALRLSLSDHILSLPTGQALSSSHFRISHSDQQGGRLKVSRKLAREGRALFVSSSSCYNQVRTCGSGRSHNI